MKSIFKKLLIIVPLVSFFLLVGYFLGNRQLSEENVSQNPQPTMPEICNALSKLSPMPGQKVTSPLTVTVTITNTNTCKWTVFEAQAGTLTLKDKTGQILGTTALTTVDEWMTDQPVNYTGTITFAKKPATTDLILIITEEDPSGQGAQEINIPLTYY